MARSGRAPSPLCDPILRPCHAVTPMLQPRPGPIPAAPARLPPCIGPPPYNCRSLLRGRPVPFMPARPTALLLPDAPSATVLLPENLLQPTSRPPPMLRLPMPPSPLPTSQSRPTSHPRPRSSSRDYTMSGGGRSNGSSHLATRSGRLLVPVQSSLQCSVGSRLKSNEFMFWLSIVMLY